jgi:enoyl-CoA hydratase/carnithine racemase
MRPTEVVLTNVEDGIAFVRLNRPAVLNALTPEVVGRLVDVIQACSEDPAVCGMVVVGEGRGFCAGADIRYQSEASEEEYASFIDQIQELTRVVRRSDLVVVAALNGLAVGGGLEFALACDQRVAAPETPMGFPEVKLGLTVTSGVHWLLPRLVGRSHALRMLVAGTSVSAEEALAMGLIDGIHRDVVSAALVLASVGRDSGPGVIARIKSALHAGEEQPLEEILEIERRLILEAIVEPGTQIRLRAFVERSNRSREPDAARPRPSPRLP